MIKAVLFVLFILSIPRVSFAQKVKYKDLVLLLNAKQYDKAEPFLKRYLKENNDNPNAFLFMGITFQEKTLTNDVLKQTDILLSNCDSAALFFDKAYNTITEKELKRNDEYYQMYSRRDLRTGEFGIKISDVRLDLENRAKSVKERKERMKTLKRFFVQMESHYSTANTSYKDIQSRYSADRTFFLRSDEALVEKLHKLGSDFDTVVTAFTNYKSALKQLGKTNYNPKISLQEIIDLKRDGASIPDFTNDDLELWDYKRWAISSIETIEKVIYPLQDRLIGHDIALNKLTHRVNKDSVSVINELAQLKDSILYSQLKEYDADPLPVAVFDMKKAEILYQSSLILHNPIRDSSNVKIKLVYLTEELRSIKLLDSITSRLAKRDINVEEENYKHFIAKAYGTKSVLASLISTTLDYAKREKLKKEIEWEATMQATKWVISGADSIPLFFEKLRELKFKPLVIAEEKYTIGLAYQDSLVTGYFYSITPTRIPDVKAIFPVDPSIFKKRNLPIVKCFSIADKGRQLFYSVIYSEEKIDEKFPVVITKIYRSDGLAWSNDFKLDMTPIEISYIEESGELSIKVSSGNEHKIITIDKNGKLVQ